jgi:hypothetical protein
MAYTEHIDQATKENAKVKNVYYSKEDYKMKLIVIKAAWKEDVSLNPRLTLAVHLPSGLVNHDVQAKVVDGGTAVEIIVQWHKVFTHPTTIFNAFGEASNILTNEC